MTKILFGFSVCVLTIQCLSTIIDPEHPAGFTSVKTRALSVTMPGGASALSPRSHIAWNTCWPPQPTVIQNTLHEVGIWTTVSILAIQHGLPEDLDLLQRLFGPIGEADVNFIQDRFIELYHEVEHRESWAPGGTGHGSILIECHLSGGQCLNRSRLLIDTHYVRLKLILVCNFKHDMTTTKLLFRL